MNDNAIVFANLITCNRTSHFYFDWKSKNLFSPPTIILLLVPQNQESKVDITFNGSEN